MSGTKVNGAASLHRAEARGEDPMGLLVDIFDFDLVEGWLSR